MDLFNHLADFFKNSISNIISYLPGSPIVYLQASSEIKQYLAWVNWFIPIYSMVSMLETWLVCVLIYYVVQVILRWLKVVE